MPSELPLLRLTPIRLLSMKTRQPSATGHACGGQSCDASGSVGAVCILSTGETRQITLVKMP